MKLNEEELRGRILSSTTIVENCRKYIEYNCTEHGILRQRDEHFKRGGCICKFCKKENRYKGNKPPLNTETIKARCFEKHGDKYLYDFSTYTGVHKKMNIMCVNHGWFQQTPHKHYTGVGCPECGKIEAPKINSKNSLIRKYKDLVQPEDYKLIPLTRGYFAIVDNDDFDRVRIINWHFENGYADSKSFGKMHRFINNTPDGFYTDHINGDRLDNRRSNLRTCTIQENALNRSSVKGSQYKGVHWNKTLNYWVARMKFKGEDIHLGYFKTEVEAAKAYDEKAKELHGQFVRLNINETK